MSALRLTLVRHATLHVAMGDTRILIDPMLGPAGSQPPIPETENQVPNPLVELPIPAASLVAGLTAAIVTHLHPDHLDQEGAAALKGGVPVLCQEREAPALTRAGLKAVPLTEPTDLGGVRVTPTSGRHGHGAIAREMGPVLGVVLAAEGLPTVYVAGDTVWCEEVAQAIEAHAPDVIVVNAGAPAFVGTEPITMNAADVVSVAEAAPEAVVIPVHMEAVNHCAEPREAVRAAAEAAGVGDRVHVPADGQTLGLSADPA